MMKQLPGDLKTVQKSQTPQNTCSKNQGACFFEVAEAPQAAATQMHRAGGPEIDKNPQNPRDTCSKNPGTCFLRSPKRRRQLRHRREGLVRLSKI